MCHVDLVPPPPPHTRAFTHTHTVDAYSICCGLCPFPRGFSAQRLHFSCADCVRFPGSFSRTDGALNREGTPSVGLIAVDIDQHISFADGMHAGEFEALTAGVGPAVGETVILPMLPLHPY